MRLSHETRLPRCGEPAAGRLNIQTITDYSDFLRLEPIWNRLLELSESDDPFLTHEWMRVWWNCFGAEGSLRILLVRADSEPVAVAPFMLVQDRMYGFKMRRLRLIHNDHTPKCGFIMTGDAKEIYKAVWAALLEQKNQWDAIEFPQLSAESGAPERLKRLADEDGFLTGSGASNNSPYVRLTGSWEDYAKHLGKHHRSNINNRLNRLQKLGTVELEFVSSRSEIPAALEEGYRLEAAAWKGEEGTAIDSSPELREFYTTFARVADGRGWLRLYFLKANGKRIAFDYCICYQNKLYSLKIGYDPKFASYSPCNLLKYLMMREAFDLGLAEKHFLGNDDKWKMNWAQQTHRYCWLYVLPSDLRGRYLHWAKFQVAPKLHRHRFYKSLRKAAIVIMSLLPWR